MTDFCCDQMAYNLNQICDLHPDRRDCPDALIARADGDYGIMIHDGGSSVTTIAFCPWCGTKLPTADDYD